MFLSYVAFFLLFHSGFLEAAQLNALFERDGSTSPPTYECILQNQTYHLDDPVLKAYGAHKKGFGNGDVKVLRASHGSNMIEKFPTLLLRLFKSIERIYFEDTNLRILDASSFNESTNKLEMIIFGEDNIQLVDSGSFEKCANLLTLIFNYNVIDDIDDDAFFGLSKLETLTLIGNNFTSISNALLQPLKSLRKLTITSNPITQIDDDFLLPLKNLVILNLSDNELLTIPAAVFRNNKNLELIDLSDNKIIWLESDFIQHLPNHVTVDFTSNDCIDKNFQDIGGEEWTPKFTNAYLVDCFENYEKTLQVVKLEDQVDDSKSNVTSGATGDNDSASDEDDDDDIKVFQKIFETVYNYGSSEEEKSPDEESSNVSEIGIGEVEEDSDYIHGRRKIITNDDFFDDVNKKKPVDDKSEVKQNSSDDDDIDEMRKDSVAKTKSDHINDDSDIHILKSDDHANGDNERIVAFNGSINYNKTNSNDTASSDNQLYSETDIKPSSTNLTENGDGSVIMKILNPKSSESGNFKNQTISPENKIIIYQNETAISSNARSKDSNVSEFSSENSASKSSINSTGDPKPKHQLVATDSNNYYDEIKEIGISSSEEFVFSKFDSDEIKEANDTFSDLINGKTKDSDEIDFLNGSEVLVGDEIETALGDSDSYEDSDEAKLKDFFVPDPKDSLHPKVDDEDISSELHLHSYEKAGCRFYVNAKNEYTGVINGAKKTLRHIEVDHIDKFDNKDVEVLFIRDSILSNVPKAFFKQFPNLKSLSVSNSEIQLAGSDLFEVCGRLRHIDLSNNKIEILRANALDECEYLESIDLSNNPLRKIESGIFATLPGLRIIRNDFEIGPR